MPLLKRPTSSSTVKLILNYNIGLVLYKCARYMLFGRISTWKSFSAILLVTDVIVNQGETAMMV